MSVAASRGFRRKSLSSPQLLFNRTLLSSLPPTLPILFLLSLSFSAPPLLVAPLLSPSRHPHLHPRPTILLVLLFLSYFLFLFPLSLLLIFLPILSCSTSFAPCSLIPFIPLLPPLSFLSSNHSLLLLILFFPLFFLFFLLFLLFRFIYLLLFFPFSTCAFSFSCFSFC